MATERRRRLAALMFVDMVGYTAIMGRDEESARALTARQRDIVGAHVARFGGTVRQYRGDGTLSVFTSAVQATRCAVAIQTELRGQPGIAVRVGIHSCDIVDDGDDLYGSGLELAEQLQSLAAPGTVLVSGKVYDEIKNQRDLHTKPLDLEGLDPVDATTRVFTVTSDNSPPPQSAALDQGARAASRSKSRISTVTIATGVAVTLVLAILATWAVRSGRAGTNQATPVASGAAGIQSIAVLPFTSLTSEPGGTSFFVEGIHDDLLTQLSKVGSIKVTAHTSVMRYAGTSKDVQTIGRELGVTTVLRGRVQRSGDAIRLNAQLIDAQSGEHLWADTYDRQLTAANVFGIQADVAEAITNALRVVLSSEEQRAIANVPTASLEAYDAYLRGAAAMRADGGLDDLEVAQVAFQEAIRLDRTFAAAYARLASVHLNMHWNAFDRSDRRLKLARAALERAEAIDPGNPEVLVSRGYYHYWGFREYAAAQAAFDAAQSALPGNARVHEAHGYVLRRVGAWPAAVRELEVAVGLDPLNAELIRALGQTLTYMGDYERAEQVLGQALTIDPDRWSALFDRALLDLMSGNDLTRLRELAAAPEVNPVITYVRWLIAYLDGNDALALTVAGEPDGLLEEQVAVYPASLLNALLHDSKGRGAQAESAADSARSVLEDLVERTPNDPRAHAALGTAYALLGRAQDALRHGREAVRLLPIERDAVDGPEYLLHLARIQALLGQVEDATATLARLLAVPTGNSLKSILLEPAFAKLRGYPALDTIRPYGSARGG